MHLRRLRARTKQDPDGGVRSLVHQDQNQVLRADVTVTQFVYLPMGQHPGGSCLPSERRMLGTVSGRRGRHGFFDSLAGGARVTPKSPSAQAARQSDLCTMARRMCSGPTS